MLANSFKAEISQPHKRASFPSRNLEVTELQIGWKTFGKLFEMLPSSPKNVNRNANRNDRADLCTDIAHQSSSALCAPVKGNTSWFRRLIPLLGLLWITMGVYFLIYHSSSSSSTRSITDYTQKIGLTGLHGLPAKSKEENNHIRTVDNRDFFTNVDMSKRHLILVVGHAVLNIEKDMNNCLTNDENWYLLEYQRNIGFPAILGSHIQRGVEEYKKDTTGSSILMFSGGQTRRDVGPISEALSYYHVAKHQGWISDHDLHTANKDAGNDAPAVYLEEYARDSFENLLYSLCRFHEITGHYPEEITIVGFDFKKTRFVDMHRKAIGFPLDTFHYISMNPLDIHSPANHFDTISANKGESEVEALFNQDPYSCGDVLHNKKVKRNPFLRTLPYDRACPEMQELLHWCGPERYDTHTLPWSSSVGL